MKSDGTLSISSDTILPQSVQVAVITNDNGQTQMFLIPTEAHSTRTAFLVKSKGGQSWDIPVTSLTDTSMENPNLFLPQQATGYDRTQVKSEPAESNNIIANTAADITTHSDVKPALPKSAANNTVSLLGNMTTQNRPGSVISHTPSFIKIPIFTPVKAGTNSTALRSPLPSSASISRSSIFQPHTLRELQKTKSNSSSAIILPNHLVRDTSTSPGNPSIMDVKLQEKVLTNIYSKPSINKYSIAGNKVSLLSQKEIKTSSRSVSVKHPSDKRPPIPMSSVERNDGVKPVLLFRHDVAKRLKPAIIQHDPDYDKPSDVSKTNHGPSPVAFFNSPSANSYGTELTGDDGGVIEDDGVISDRLSNDNTLRTVKMISKNHTRSSTDVNNKTAMAFVCAPIRHIPTGPNTRGTTVPSKSSKLGIASEPFQHLLSLPEKKTETVFADKSNYDSFMDGSLIDKNKHSATPEVNVTSTNTSCELNKSQDLKISSVFSLCTKQQEDMATPEVNVSSTSASCELNKSQDLKISSVFSLCTKQQEDMVGINSSQMELKHTATSGEQIEKEKLTNTTVIDASNKYTDHDSKIYKKGIVSLLLLSSLSQKIKSKMHRKLQTLEIMRKNKCRVVLRLLKLENTKSYSFKEFQKMGCTERCRKSVMDALYKFANENKGTLQDEATLCVKVDRRYRGLSHFEVLPPKKDTQKSTCFAPVTTDITKKVNATEYVSGKIINTSVSLVCRRTVLKQVNKNSPLRSLHRHAVVPKIAKGDHEYAKEGLENTAVSHDDIVTEHAVVPKVAKGDHECAQKGPENTTVSHDIVIEHATVPKIAKYDHAYAKNELDNPTVSHDDITVTMPPGRPVESSSSNLSTCSMTTSVTQKRIVASSNRAVSASDESQLRSPSTSKYFISRTGANIVLIPVSAFQNAYSQAHGSNVLKSSKSLTTAVTTNSFVIAADLNVNLNMTDAPVLPFTSGRLDTAVSTSLTQLSPTEPRIKTDVNNMQIKSEPATSGHMDDNENILAAEKVKSEPLNRGYSDETDNALVSCPMTSTDNNRKHKINEDQFREGLSDTGESF